MSEQSAKTLPYNDETLYFDARKNVEDIKDFENLSFTTCVPLAAQIEDLKETKNKSAKRLREVLEYQYDREIAGDRSFVPLKYDSKLSFFYASDTFSSVYELVNVAHIKNPAKDFQVVVSSKLRGLMPSFQVSRASFLEAYESGLIGHISDLYGRIGDLLGTIGREKTLFYCESTVNMTNYTCFLRNLEIGRGNLNVSTSFPFEENPFIEKIDLSMKGEPFAKVPIVFRLNEFIRRLECFVKNQQDKFAKLKESDTGHQLCEAQITIYPKNLYHHLKLKKAKWYMKPFMLGSYLMKPVVHRRVIVILPGKQKYTLLNDSKDKLDSVLLTQDEFNKIAIFPLQKLVN